jgi:hypothetical protein
MMQNGSGIAASTLSMASRRRGGAVMAVDVDWEGWRKVLGVCGRGAKLSKT